MGSASGLGVGPFCYLALLGFFIMSLTTNALWNWNTTNPNAPFVVSYYGGTPTKTLLTPNAIREFAGVPLVRYGRPPVPMSDSQLFEILRSAEDAVEQESGVLLTPTMVASPPTRSGLQSIAASVNGRAANGGQQLGIDYDLADSAYDFKFDRAKEEGWLEQGMRYKPLRIYDGTATAIKQLSYIYPLLNSYYQIPTSWYQEDLDFGFVRIVPAVNVTLLPLFALQLAVQGFSQSVPGGMWYWYSAGLGPTDYQSRFRFVNQLVLCEAAIVALMTCQGTVNQGLDQSEVLADGVSTKFRYRAGGAYNDLIQNFTKQKEALMDKLSMCVGGISVEVL